MKTNKENNDKNNKKKNMRRRTNKRILRGLKVEWEKNLVKNRFLSRFINLNYKINSIFKWFICTIKCLSFVLFTFYFTIFALKTFAKFPYYANLKKKHPSSATFSGLFISVFLSFESGKNTKNGEKEKKNRRKEKKKP